MPISEYKWAVSYAPWQFNNIFNSNKPKDEEKGWCSKEQSESSETSPNESITNTKRDS